MGFQCSNGKGREPTLNVQMTLHEEQLFISKWYDYMDMWLLWETFSKHYNIDLHLQMHFQL